MLVLPIWDFLKIMAMKVLGFTVEEDTNTSSAHERDLALHKPIFYPL